MHPTPGLICRTHRASSCYSGSTIITTVLLDVSSDSFVGCCLSFLLTHAIKTLQVDKPKVGSRGRETWGMGLVLFPRFSSFGKVMSDPC